MLYSLFYLDLPFFLPLGFIGLYRWFWWTLKFVCYALYRPIIPKKNPRYKPSAHATIVIPTIDSGPEIKRALESWVANDPFEVIFVTVPKAQPALEKLSRSVDPQGHKVRVITVAKGNKRNQMVAGINQVRTPILVFADDDVLWPKDFLKYVLAPFEDSRMGGVGTSQKVLPIGKWMSFWEIMAAFRVTMRTIEATASTFIDGGITCLSGRTAIYRTSILRDPKFQQEFTHEYWSIFGKKYHLHSGDDKFLTRWVQNHEWKTHIQTCPQSTLLSTFKDNWTFLRQLLRWTRNSWRSDITQLFFVRKIWIRYPYTAFTMFDKIFNPITMFFGPAAVIYIAISWVYLVSYFVYLVATRLVKYTLHFTQRPQDIIHLPGLVLFNFLFSFMKVYCLFTLHVTSWGTRAGADTATDQVDEAIYKVHFADIPDVGEIGKDGLEKKSDDSFVVQVPFSPVKTKSSISLADSAFSSSSVPNVARDANVAAIPEEGIVVTVRAGKDEITPQGKGKTSPVRKRFN